MTAKKTPDEKQDEKKPDLLGVNETVDLIHGTFEFTRKLILQAKDGFQLIPDVVATVLDKDVQAALAAAVNNIKLIGDEVKELSINDYETLVISVLGEVKELLNVINAEVTREAANQQLLDVWKASGMRMQRPEKK